jgi:hypothetical protein
MKKYKIYFQINSFKGFITCNMLDESRAKEKVMEKITIIKIQCLTEDNLKKEESNPFIDSNIFEFLRGFKK